MTGGLLRMPKAHEPVRGCFGLVMLWVCRFGVVTFGPVITVHGAVPTLTSVIPNAANPGSHVPVKFAGKLDGTARRVWSDDPTIEFTLPDASGNALVTVAKDARPGLHLVRFVNAEGATLPLRFAVGPLPIVEEKEPNDKVSEAQVLSKLPVWVQGRLEKGGDVDNYALTLVKGVPLFVQIAAYALGSPVDLHFHVLDHLGVKLATASDSRNLDPELTFIPPEDGAYTLQVAGFEHKPLGNVRFTGMASCFYQMAVTDGPVVKRIFPAAIPNSGSGEVELRGQGVLSEGSRVTLQAAPVVGSVDVGTVFPKGAITPLDVVLAKYPVKVVLDATGEHPAELVVPAVVAGQLTSPGAVAGYRIAMKKGDRLQARLWSRSIGLGVEGVLVVNDPAGKQLAENPNPSDVFTEPSVGWTAAVDGEHVLFVKDLFQRGGEGYEFVVEVGAPTPGYSVELAEGKPVHIELGKTLVLKGKATFIGGWKEPLTVRLNGLPEGVFATAVTVPEKGGDFEVTLQAAANAPSGTTAAVVSVWTAGASPIFREVVYSLHGELRRGHSQSDFGRELWVSVGPPPAAQDSAPTKK